MVISNNTNTTNNMNTTNNTNNIISIIDILGEPEKKTDKIYYGLYDHPERTAEEIIKTSGMSLQSFRNLASRDPNLITLRKEDKTAIYGISKELRESLDLQIIQKKRFMEELKAEREEEIKKKGNFESLLFDVKLAARDENLFSHEGNQHFLDLEYLKEVYLPIYEELQGHPEDMVQVIELGLEETGLYRNPRVRFKNFADSQEKRTIDSLRSSDLNKLLVIEAKSTTLSDVRPQVVNAKFECPSCGTVISVLQIEKKFREPTRCSCGRKGSFKLISKDMVDTARVTLEDLKDLSDSPNLKILHGTIQDDLTSQEIISRFNPGNDLRVLGVLKEVPVQINNGISTRYDQALIILSAETFEPEININSFTEEEIKQFEAVSKEINEKGLDNLIKSYAPSVSGYAIEKKALILQAAQSRNRKEQETRGKSNILLIGPPGIAKSVLGKFTKNVTVGSSMVSGSGASQVGLTAVAEKQDDGWILKPGVLPTTKELCIIDEFNLMDEMELPKLQEAMSEQQITINKAGIHAKLRVSCGILALANPTGGVFL